MSLFIEIFYRWNYSVSSNNLLRTVTGTDPKRIDYNQNEGMIFWCWELLLSNMKTGDRKQEPDWPFFRKKMIVVIVNLRAGDDFWIFLGAFEYFQLPFTIFSQYELKVSDYIVGLGRQFWCVVMESQQGKIWDMVFQTTWEVKIFKQTDSWLLQTVLARSYVRFGPSKSVFDQIKNLDAREQFSDNHGYQIFYFVWTATLDFFVLAS